ncbi:MAG: SAM-dependent methyltransferase [Bacteroidaceae bacterium]|nr:SAM-dependent methyltransferase [Bacteroidaceae bacterium]
MPPISRQIQDFLRAHRTDDVRELLLAQSRYPEIDMAWAACQISGWQTACQKLPLWAQTDGILYPPRLNMEQCSSQQAATYKAQIVSGGETMTDLTAGFGVDATMLAQKYRHLNYVETDATLCSIAENNLPLLGITRFSIHHANATETLRRLPRQDLIYIDPARRNQYGQKVYALCDCTPDVTKMQDLLAEKADTVLLKLSPMLDIEHVKRTLKNIVELHIVSINGECKELLVKLQSIPLEETEIHCVNIKATGITEQFCFTAHTERSATCHYADTLGQYLYEPNASLMKAAPFKSLAQAYGLQKVSPHSHLYTSDHPVADFPGRIFHIETTLTLNKRDVKEKLSALQQANITVRNFPLTVAQLRQRLKLKEGGNDYLFATTLNDGSHILIHSTTYCKTT